MLKSGLEARASEMLVNRRSSFSKIGKVSCGAFGLRAHSTSHLNMQTPHHPFPMFKPADKLSLEDLNKNVLKCKYAVRGKIPMRALELEEQLKKDPGSLPFNKVIYCNIGNPQQLDQKPLTFNRQVLSILEYPSLLKSPSATLAELFNKDILARAKRMLDDCGGTVGAYSHSQGVLGYRESVAKFLRERDGEEASADDIFLTAGASSSVNYLLSAFSRGAETGVLIPIPQYPLYTATITRNGSHALPYYLDESTGWSINPEIMERTILDALKQGIKPTCIVVINPGNPTGAVLAIEDMEKIFHLAAKYGIVVIADEVYQQNVFQGVEFHSMKKILRSLQRKHPKLYDNVQLASLHSVSKGLFGECGQRGGYMELVGFDHEINQVFLKLASISLCPVVIGQALVDLLVNQPLPGDPSYEIHEKEKEVIHRSLEERSSFLWRTFNSLEGIECQRPLGAMYLFPRLHLPKKAINAAKALHMEPDEFYCQELLDSTGICTVPGSGFGQAPGTYHLRTTFLAPGIEWIKAWEKFHKDFFEDYRD